MWRRASVLAVVLLASGCASMPDDVFRPTDTTMALRSVQTRSYESVSDAEILSASSAVLQDMGYAIDEIEVPLGLVSASKRADASNALEFFGSVIVEGVKCVFTLTLGCSNRSYDEIGDVQDIRMTIVSRPTLRNSEEVTVRVTIQQIIWDKKGRISLQRTIDDTDVYTAFFDRMSKAVFLEQEGL